MAPIGYRVLQENGVAFLAATDAVGLLGSTAGGARHLGEER